MKPSQVLNAYRIASRHARHVGSEFKVSKTRLQGWGWTEDKIGKLFLAMEKVDDMELHYDAIARELDAQTSRE